jgi:1-acyl-sn-glycerol-3-phosphate acyltransferase
MFRFFWLNGFIALHSILFCLWAIFLSLFDREGRLIHFYAAVPWAKVTLWVSGIRVRVSGLENVDPQFPRIYMTNHQSYFDIFALLAHLPVNFKFILKQELMKIPLFGQAVRRAGYIGLERGDPREAVKSMNRAAERIRDGASVVMFPEGTRSTDGRLLPFKRGGFNLALKSGCEVVPVSVKDSFRIVPKGSFKINRGSFDMFIGRPIPTRDLTKKDIGFLMEVVRNAMLEHVEDSQGGSKAEESLSPWVDTNEPI